jgi:molybdenum cofactor cytidylyltransferase
MAEVSAIVLAAGLSRRMGAENKLLLEIGGQTLIRYVVTACGVATGSPPIVVLGHQAPAVAAALADTPARLAVNPDYALGQMTSVICGLRMAPATGHVLIALGDQPRITAAVLRPLIAAHLAQGGGRITVPMRGTGPEAERGNPILIPAALRDRILEGGANLGCRHLTRKHPELVHAYDTGCDAFFVDMDTPEDLARERAALAETLPLDKPAMTSHPSGLNRLWRRVFPPLSAEQAELLARVKLPCC